MTPNDGDSNDLMTHQVAHAINDHGPMHSYIDGEIIEFEIDRPNPPKEFPSRYCILGLRLTEQGVMNYSVEPMFKPQNGDAYEEDFSSPEEEHAVRERVSLFIKEVLSPILAAKKLTLGVEVDSIHSDDPTPVPSKNEAPLPTPPAAKAGRKASR